MPFEKLPNVNELDDLSDYQQEIDALDEQRLKERIAQEVQELREYFVRTVLETSPSHYKRKYGSLIESNNRFQYLPESINIVIQEIREQGWFVDEERIKPNVYFHPTGRFERDCKCS